MVFDVIREPGDLHTLVRGRDSNQNGFVKPAAKQFDLAIFYQHFQELEIFRMMLFDPGEQRARIVQAHAHPRVFFENFEEWQVATRIRLLEDVAEIAAGLMRVNDQNHMKLGRHGREIVSWKTA